MDLKITASGSAETQSFFFLETAAKTPLNGVWG